MYHLAILHLMHNDNVPVTIMNTNKSICTHVKASCLIIATINNGNSEVTVK